MRGFKKAAACIIIASMALNSAAFAEEEGIKDETVYVNLTSDGKIRNTVVVNAFKINGQKKIVDYGNYENIKNLSGVAKPSVNNGYVEFEIDPTLDMFYYQGELKGVNLPWDFEIKYFLDGAETTGEELIGKSGNVEIEFSAISNPRVNSYFSDNYLAQITIVFDAEKFKNILCSDAMTATLGSNKQLSFMVLPGMDKTYRISASAQEFEMDGMTIAMVKVSEGISETLEGLKISVGEMTSGISQLIDGSGRLKNGAEDLSNAISLLNSGVSSVARLAPSLTAGMNELDKGAWSIYDGAKTLSAASSQIRGGLGELDSNSAALIKGIDAISGGISEMANKKSAVKAGISELNGSKSSINELTSGVETLFSGYKTVEENLAAAAAKRDEISAGVDELKSADTDISALSGGLDQLKSGLGDLSYANSQQRQIMDALLQAAQNDPNLAPYAGYIATAQAISATMGDGFSSASYGIDSLLDGVDAAQEGINSLSGAANTFADAALALTDASAQLCDGMKELNGGFDKLKSGIGSVNKLYNAANSFADSSLKLAEGAEKLSGAMEELRRGAEEYTGGVNTLAVNYIELDRGMFELENGAAALSGGISEMYSGADSVVSAVGEIGDNINRLDSSASTLPDSIDLLRMGGGQIIQGVGGSSGDIGNLIALSSEATPVSFAAPGIVNPRSVQFAIKTPDLHMPDEKAEETETEKVGFFTKLINLFKKKES